MSTPTIAGAFGKYPGQSATTCSGVRVPLPLCSRADANPGCSRRRHLSASMFPSRIARTNATATGSLLRRVNMPTPRSASLTSGPLARLEADKPVAQTDQRSAKDDEIRAGTQSNTYLSVTRPRDDDARCRQGAGIGEQRNASMVAKGAVGPRRARAPCRTAPRGVLGIRGAVRSSLHLSLQRRESRAVRRTSAKTTRFICGDKTCFRRRHCQWIGRGGLAPSLHGFQFT
jgi:hypothetical protein